jgi:hypothetical protein
MTESQPEPVTGEQGVQVTTTTTAEPVTPAAQPEPEPDPGDANQEGQPGPSRADEPGTLGEKRDEALDDAAEAEDSAPDSPGPHSTDTHPSIQVRLRDVLATVENWFARNPHIGQGAATDLKSALGSVERP